MKRKTLCHSVIDSHECLLYLSPYSRNSELFAVPKEANRRPWCLLYGEPCTSGLQHGCGLMCNYKLKITITADAELLSFCESPDCLIVPLRDFVYKTLRYAGEPPVVTIDYERNIEADDKSQVFTRTETRELLKDLSDLNPTWDKFKKYYEEYCEIFCDDFEREWGDE